MKCYRIAKVALPWTNLEPPIRDTADRCCAGSFAHKVEGDAHDASDASSDIGSYGSSDESALSSATSVDLDSDIVKTTPVKRIGRDPLGQLGPSAKLRITRAEYITSLEKEEIDSDILAYPSLDYETQEAISREYAALHERISKEGFYNCRYSAYGKDAIRWGILFGGFLYFLSIQWYLTSAVFLGMFWVCALSNLDWNRSNC